MIFQPPHRVPPTSHDYQNMLAGGLATLTYPIGVNEGDNVCPDGPIQDVFLLPKGSRDKLWIPDDPDQVLTEYEQSFYLFIYS